MHFPLQSAVGREHVTCILSMEIKKQSKGTGSSLLVGLQSYKVPCVTLICSSRRPASDVSLPSTTGAQFPGSRCRTGSESCFPPWQLWPQRCSRAASWGNGQPPTPFIPCPASAMSVYGIRLRWGQDVGTLQKSSMPWNTPFKQGSHFLLPWLLKLYQASAAGLQFNIFI